MGYYTPEHDEVEEIVDIILADYQQGRNIDKMEVASQPDYDVIITITKKLLRIFFPGYYREKFYKGYNQKYSLSALIEDVLFTLRKQILLVIQFDEAYEGLSAEELDEKAHELTIQFAHQIPKLREYIDTDMQATFDGDPAASGTDEIVLCYPGLYASTLNRIAHELFLLKVPLIPRMITEYAHRRTGIDIHPGATIGKYFCIDHGTGIVVGSSTIIGDHVKIYQGVTLGALSTRKGQLLRGTKRHPTIEDYVTVYSGASILGGDTVIGKNSVIGGNAFLTSSVPENSRIAIQNQKLDMKVDGQEEISSLEQDSTWFYII